jgi:hypothetical protein
VAGVAQIGRIHREQARQFGMHELRRVGGAHQGEHGLLHPQGQPGGGAAGCQHAVRPGAFGAGVRALPHQHGSHMVGQRIAVQSHGRLQHQVHVGVLPQPLGIGAQKGGNVLALQLGQRHGRP